jgi:hypothetical protein
MLSLLQCLLFSGKLVTKGSKYLPPNHLSLKQGFNVSDKPALPRVIWGQLYLHIHIGLDSGPKDTAD